MKRRYLSILLTVCMMLTLLPTVVLAAETTGNFGAFTVTYDGVEPTYSNNTLTLGTGTYIISGTTTIDRIKLSYYSTANVTLSNVNIDLSGKNGACAFDMAVATVNLTLIGTNTLRSGNGAAGLLVAVGSRLTVTAQSTGSLTAEATNIDGTGLPGAGIGGATGIAIDCGTITINGGTITATGGYVSTTEIGGAGIGGGGAGVGIGYVGPGGQTHGGNGGTVTINGGVVTAIGGHGAANTGASGAGIGGGGAGGNGSGLRAFAGRGGTVTINGGFVTATGNNNSAGIGGGGATPSAGLAGGSGGNGGTVIITGGTVIATGGAYRGAGIGGGGGAFEGYFANVTITGGSVKAKAGIYCTAPIGYGAYETSCSSVGNMVKYATNAEATLYTITLPNISTATAVTAVTFTPPLGYTYGTTDMKTDTDGKLYLYLPKGLKDNAQSKVIITTAAGVYESSVTNNTLSMDRVVLSVSGTVTPGTTGASVSGLTVDLYESSDTSFGSSMGSAVTDGNGSYSINDIPPGNYVARVAGVYGSYAASVSSTIDVNSGAVSGMDIALIPLTTKSITVKAGSQKTAYTAGDSLDVTNLQITVTLSDDFTYDMNVTADMVSGFDSSAAAASQTLTVTFEGQTATFPISISRVPYNGSNAPTPSLIGKTNTQVVLDAVTVDGQTVEYGKSTQTGNVPTDWQLDTTFTGLTAGTTYYFFARVKQTGAMEAGGISTTALSVTTKNAAPAAPSLAFHDITANSVDITPVMGAQYSKDGGLTWQDSGNFTGLYAATQYTFAIRIKETDDTVAGAAASQAQYTAAAAPSAGEGYTIDYNAETISVAGGYEVSGDSPSAITPGGTLNIRVKATSSVPASGWTTITIPERPATTGLSVTAVRTDTTINVTAITGAEYSKDGGTTWQSSNEFSGLNPNTEYAMNIRYAATASSFSSSPLGSVTIKTKTASADAPSAPSVSAQTHEAITIDSISGYQYAITTDSTAPTTWGAVETANGTKTFFGLSPATQYQVWVRVAETDTAMPSGHISKSVYTAAAAPSAGEGFTIDYSAGTISIASGYEVSSDSSFAGDKLISNGAAVITGATYFVRVKSISDIPASDAVSFTVAAKPDAPPSSAYSYDYHVEQIIFNSSYEVYTANDGTGSSVTSDSTAITPGGTLYIRVKATSSAPASGWTTITIPERPATTGLSVTAVRTDTTITVAASTGAEYSKDGGATWQSSNAFTGLHPNSDYFINIRYAATASSFTSLPLGSVAIKTKTASADAPSAPGIGTDADKPTSTSLTINAVAGNEYYISTSSSAPTTWPTSGNSYHKAIGTDNHTFTGLTAGTQYYIYARVAETDSAMPSGYSTQSVYTAAATPGAGVGYTINYSAETINITSGYEVSSDASFAGDKLLSNGATIAPGATYYVRKALDTTTTPNIPASTAIGFTVAARPEMPAVTGHNETVDGKNDGRISGVTEAMEWKAAGGTYASVTTAQASNGITGLSDGTYYVRYMAVSGTGFKSAEQEITLAAGHSITVIFNSQGGSDVAAITGKAYGDSAAAPADPTRSGFYFAGWYREAACANAWSFTLDTLTDNTTLYAKWSSIPIYTVTGKIVDDASLAVEGATVKIMQGATQYGTTGVTDANGDFEIDNVPPGTYNLVITQGIRKAIIKVNVSSGNVAVGNATLPSGNANSILVVNGSSTPSIVVGALDSEAEAQLADSVNPLTDKVEITLTVEEKDVATAANGSEVASAVISVGKQVGMILAIDVSKTVNDTADTSYNQTNTLIEIIIPLPTALQGKATYAVYRYHGTGVDAITETANTDGERIVIDRTNWMMTLYAKKFSTYAIGYTNPIVDGGGGSSTSYTITASAGEGGGISPSGKVNVIGGNKTFTITANEGYEITDVKVDGVSVGAVGSYTFSNVGADHTITAVFARKENAALPYYIENGKDIFIGFSSDASGTMTYIAPKSATVLFRGNPKSFNDIASHWAKDYIDFVTERELFLGTGNDEFSPQSGMTRAMFATVIGRLYEKSYGKLLHKDNHAFTDVDYQAYYGAYIDWASENTIITGIGGGLFEPDREITRQEMATILYRFAVFMNFPPSSSEKTQLNYPDAAHISSWAAEAAIYCQETGIITGRSGGNFVPQGTATRAEVAVILQRLIEISVGH